MSTTEVRQPTDPAPFVLRALVWSLVIHLLCFGVWKVGRTEGWWQAQMPAWMLALERKLLTPIEIKLPPPQAKNQNVPLLFVDTDPALAVKEPPKNTKFYSANNTEAANIEIKKPSEVPNLTGTQTHVPKATDSEKSKPKPLEPTPPKPEEQEQQERKAQPEQKMGIGDLAMAKPNQGQAMTNSEAVKEQQPQHHRPRTLAEARDQLGLKGQAMRQEGGARRQLVPSFAAAATSYGDYDRELVDAVQTRWDQLLEGRTETVGGLVVVSFRLLPTGRVTDVKVIKNTVDEINAELCASAILDSAPFRAWPRQMQLDIGADHRDVQFTFFYLNE